MYNVVTNFLSRLTRVAEKELVDDVFLDEHLFSISVQTPWFVYLANYLDIGKFLRHFSYNRKCEIITKSVSFSYIKGYLFILALEFILRRCIKEDGVYDIINAYHNDPSSGHYAANRPTYKILQIGYYWPTLLKMQYIMFLDVMIVKEWRDPLKKMRRFQTPELHLNHFKSGVQIWWG